MMCFGCLNNSYRIVIKSRKVAFYAINVMSIILGSDVTGIIRNFFKKLNKYCRSLVRMLDC